MFDNKLLRFLALGTSIGSGFVGSVLLGLFAGNYFDQKFKTAPWLLLAGVFLGITMGIMSTVHIIKLINKHNE